MGVKIGDDAPERRPKESFGAIRRQNFKGKEMRGEDQVGRVEGELPQKRAECQPVNSGKKEGQPPWHGIAPSIESIKKTGKATGEEKVGGAIEKTEERAASLQEILDSYLRRRGDTGKGLCNGVGRTHVAASDICAQYQDLAATFGKGFRGVDGDLLCTLSEPFCREKKTVSSRIHLKTETGSGKMGVSFVRF
jgi:hypothetical protein